MIKKNKNESQDHNVILPLTFNAESMKRSSIKSENIHKEFLITGLCKDAKSLADFQSSIDQCTKLSLNLVVNPLKPTEIETEGRIGAKVMRNKWKNMIKPKPDFVYGNVAVEGVNISNGTVTFCLDTFKSGNILILIELIICGKRLGILFTNGLLYCIYF